MKDAERMHRLMWDLYVSAVCVCLCLCVRERERERKKEKHNFVLKCLSTEGVPGSSLRFVEASHEIGNLM